MRAGAAAADLARGLDEVDRIAAMLVDPGGDGENVGVEDDVVRLGPVGGSSLYARSQIVDLALARVGLADSRRTP